LSGYGEWPGRSEYARSPWYDDEPGQVAVAEQPYVGQPYSGQPSSGQLYSGAPGDDGWAEVERPAKGGRVTRVVVIVSAVAALLLVGLVAFGATVLLGGGPASKKAANSADTGVPANLPSDNAGAGVIPTPSPNAAADPTPTGAPTAAPTQPASPPAAKTKKPAPNPPNVANLPAETAVLVLVNAERAKAGCRALTVDSRLAAAARKHSADMVARDYFSHTTPDGVSFSQRIDAEGYQWSRVGENIAAGQRSATEVMKAWMKSPGHRANILNCQFRNIGIGVVQNGRSPVWTQDFGTPR
jgi:uncharacterized protein YkwD